MEFIAKGGGTLLETDFRKEIRDRAVVSLFAEVPILINRLENERLETAHCGLHRRRGATDSVSTGTAAIRMSIAWSMVGHRAVVRQHLLGLFEDKALGGSSLKSPSIMSPSAAYEPCVPGLST